MYLVIPDELNRLFAFVCGQNPGHTWMPGGVTLPCCERCLGLYVGAALAMLLHSLIRPKLTGRFLEIHGLFLAVMLPLGFHWIEQSRVIRTISGLAFGFAVVTFLWLPFAHEKSGSRIAENLRVLAYWFFMALIALLLPLAASAGGRVTAHALAAMALAGLLTAAGLGLAVVCVGLFSAARLLMHRNPGERGHSCPHAGPGTATARRP